ncbi:nucleotidyltransferase [Mycoplasma sp. 744]|uniref:nucleotidyltransferase n=1 Tax=Mycoplasma sp. 744 TaxID=3108531 RepID=UPI002B1E44FD|nr:nucleotidyltransferase [Mycoplasma sp. 744]MEA4115446.1 nucleotidyltransferase [Mycoplasma sp. 744]
MIGIVVEYNPFHNGHIRQLNWIKEKFPNEKITIVMSYKYSQRGEKIVLSYRKRKHLAKKYGVNKIIKLKFRETVQAAHIFAQNALKKLVKVKIDKLVFGSESNDCEEMFYLAKLIKNNQEQLNKKIKYYSKIEKLAYPKAYALALKDLSGKNYLQPNDILGFEYIKEILNKKYQIKVYTIKRNIAFHSLEPQTNYASASYLRTLIQNNQTLNKYSPIKKIKYQDSNQKMYKKFQQNIQNKKYWNKIIKLNVINEGIENLLLKHVSEQDLNSFLNKTTSKRYTKSRILRIIAWIATKQWKKHYFL